MKNKWSILYLLLNLSEDPRKQTGKVSERASAVSCGTVYHVVIGRKIIGEEQTPAKPGSRVVFHSQGQFLEDVSESCVILMEQCIEQPRWLKS